MAKISGLGLGEIKKMSGLGLGQIQKVSGLGLGTIWQLSSSPPTFVASSVASTNSASANIACNYPAGSASGDLLVLFVGFQRVPTSGTQSINTPSGWTLADTLANSVGQVVSVFWRFRGAETSVTATCSNGTSEYGTAIIHAYNGSINSTTPINAVDINSNTSVNAGGARSVPNISTTVDNCAISLFMNVDKSSAGTVTWSGATEETDNYSGTSGRMVFSSARTQQLVAGAIGSISWTPVGLPSESLNASVAIAPA